MANSWCRIGDASLFDCPGEGYCEYWNVHHWHVLAKDQVAQAIVISSDPNSEVELDGDDLYWDFD